MGALMSIPTKPLRVANLEREKKAKRRRVSDSERKREGKERPKR